MNEVGLVLCGLGVKCMEWRRRRAPLPPIEPPDYEYDDDYRINYTSGPKPIFTRNVPLCFTPLPELTPEEMGEGEKEETEETEETDEKEEKEEKEETSKV